MKQPLKRKKKITTKYGCNSTKQPIKVVSTPVAEKKVFHKKYGTSKLERNFASDFLDRLGIKYIYQFEAKDIKRYYDFAVTVYDDYPYRYENKDGIKSIIQEGKEILVGFLIEVDGDFYHSNPLKVKKDDMNPMQKHNKFVDKLKDEWAKSHGIPLLRIWENDIRNNMSKVIKEIKKLEKKKKKRKMIVENKRKPH